MSPSYNIGAFAEVTKKVFAQRLFDESSGAKERLGEIRPLSDGRVFAYAKAGGVALAPALLATFITTPVHEDTVTVAHSVGTKLVTITAAGATAGQFRDGTLIITQGTGIGESYKIKDNDAADGSNLIRVQLYEGLATAWSVSDTDVDLYPNPYNGLVVNPTDGQQKPQGVPVRTITANYYFWLQIAGFAPLILDTSGGAAGLELDEKYIQVSTNTAGQGMLTTTPANADMKHIIGEVVKEQDVADGTATLVSLRLH